MKVKRASFKALLGLWISASVAASSLLGVPSAAGQVSMEGAKDLFFARGNSKESGRALGLTYSIELNRKGQTSKVDSRHEFYSGDQIKFYVQPNVEGYMYIVLTSGSTGSSAVLFPAEGMEDDNRVERYKQYVFPQSGALEFDNHTGMERLQLVLSTSPLQPTDLKRERSIIIRSKGAAQTDSQSLVSFSEPEKPTMDSSSRSMTGTPDFSKPAVTLVSKEVSKPFVVDLFLDHLPPPGAIATKPATQTSTPTITSTSTTQSPSTHGGPLDGPVNDKWAVVVGISDFQDPRINLMYPAKDAKDFADYLVKEANFSRDHVKVLLNKDATQSNILGVLGSTFLPHNAKPGDLVVIYFAGHGTSSQQDVAGQNFLVAYDTDPINPFAGRGIEMNELVRTIKRRIQTDRIVLVLDTCHSAAAQSGAKIVMPPFKMEKVLQGTGQLVIASSDVNQISHDSKRYENGIFTRHLIDGLRQYPDLPSAYQYIKSAVSEESRTDFRHDQTPVLHDADWKGAPLVMAAKPAMPRSVIEPVQRVLAAPGAPKPQGQSASASAAPRPKAPAPKN